MCSINLEYKNVGADITSKRHRQHNGCQKNPNDKAAKGRKTCRQKSGLYFERFSWKGGLQAVLPCLIGGLICSRRIKGKSIVFVVICLPLVKFTHKMCYVNQIWLMCFVATVLSRKSAPPAAIKSPHPSLRTENILYEAMSFYFNSFRYPISFCFVSSRTKL